MKLIKLDNSEPTDRDNLYGSVCCTTCSSLSSPKLIPPDMRTVAVSGTRKTFQPRLSKNVARWAWPVVFPPHGPPVRTNLWTLLVGGTGSRTSRSFISPLSCLLSNVYCLLSVLIVCLEL